MVDSGYLALSAASSSAIERSSDWRWSILDSFSFTNLSFSSFSSLYILYIIDSSAGEIGVAIGVTPSLLSSGFLLLRNMEPRPVRSHSGSTSVYATKILAIIASVTVAFILSLSNNPRFISTSV